MWRDDSFVIMWRRGLSMRRLRGLACCVRLSTSSGRRGSETAELLLLARYATY